MDSQALGATGASQKAKKPPAMLTAPRMAFADTLLDNQSCFGCGFHKRCGRELASPLGVVCQPGANVEQSGFEAGAVALAGDDQAVNLSSPRMLPSQVGTRTEVVATKIKKKPFALR